jgi:sulfite reductase beta subunit-like hemoprotein
MNLYKVIRSYLLRVRSRIGRISRRQWIEIAGVTALFTVLSIAYTNFIAKV